MTATMSLSQRADALEAKMAEESTTSSSNLADMLAEADMSPPPNAGYDQGQPQSSRPDGRRPAAAGDA